MGFFTLSKKTEDNGTVISTSDMASVGRTLRSKFVSWHILTTWVPLTIFNNAIIIRRRFTKAKNASLLRPPSSRSPRRQRKPSRFLHPSLRSIYSSRLQQWPLVAAVHCMRVQARPVCKLGISMTDRIHLLRQRASILFIPVPVTCPLHSHYRQEGRPAHLPDLPVLFPQLLASLPTPSRPSRFCFFLVFCEAKPTLKDDIGTTTQRAGGSQLGGSAQVCA